MTLTRSDLESMVGGPVVIENGVARRITEVPKDAPRSAPRDRYKSKWERQYATDLTTLRLCGLIQWWAYEAIKLRLADGAWYTPDFAVMAPVAVIGGGHRLEVREVKGYWREAARVRVKVAAEQFPWLPISIVQYQNGQWRTIETFNW